MALAFGFGAFTVSAVIVVVIAVFLWQLARGALGDDARTFRVLHRVAWAVTGIAGSMASFEALQIRSASWTAYPDDWSPQDALPQPAVFVPFEFWPLGVAAALLVVAAILRYGARLQKDTEGLV
ncbi:hypothetical protein [Streptomyces sp. AC495_CC817]|uniref:hypothetical protein n=1 Tax=Streptomyces sp. AC495_CC817 TaxID=2823900 RepID=UPI001C25D914|nr:hypothetical protein [Streptomyces sp. AC495_CC817]